MVRLQSYFRAVASLLLASIALVEVRQRKVRAF